MATKVDDKRAADGRMEEEERKVKIDHRMTECRIPHWAQLKPNQKLGRLPTRLIPALPIRRSTLSLFIGFVVLQTTSLEKVWSSVERKFFHEYVRLPPPSV